MTNPVISSKYKHELLRSFVFLKKWVKTAFHFRVFHTHVYARKTSNSSTFYIFQKYIDK